MDNKAIQFTAVVGTAFTMLTGAAILTAAHSQEILARPVGQAGLILWVIWTVLTISFWPVKMKLFQSRFHTVVGVAVGLFLLGTVTLAVPWEYTHFAGPLERDGVLSWIGIGVFGAGNFLHLITMWTIQGYFSERKLLKDQPWYIGYGVYRLIRHPLYASILLVIFGISLALSSLIGLAISLLTTIMVVILINKDEKVLARSSSSEYLHYLQQCRWKLIPGIF